MVAWRCTGRQLCPLPSRGLLLRPCPTAHTDLPGESYPLISGARPPDGQISAPDTGACTLLGRISRLPLRPRNPPPPMLSPLLPPGSAPVAPPLQAPLLHAIPAGRTFRPLFRRPLLPPRIVRPPLPAPAGSPAVSYGAPSSAGGQVRRFCPYLSLRRGPLSEKSRGEMLISSRASPEAPPLASRASPWPLGSRRGQPRRPACSPPLPSPSLPPPEDRRAACSPHPAWR